MNIKSLRKKRTVCAVLLILLLNVAGMTNVFAHDFEVDNLLYTITSTNPPTVSLDGHVDGTSASDELLISETVVYGSVTYAVTAIGDNAFADCTDMYGDIIIPNSVVTVGNYAFNNAGFDGSLSIGSSVTTIGSYAFANLGSTGGDLHIPNAVTTIGDHAFYQSYFDGTFTLSTSVISIGDYAFYNLSLLSVSPLALPNTLTYVGDYAFYHCSGMTGRLTLSTALTSVGAHAFDGCGFTQLNFGSTTNSQLQAIGDAAFYNCSSMTGNLAFPLSIQSVGQYAFANCGFTGNLNLRNMQTIGANAFSNVPFNSNGLTIPASVTEIGEGAFSGCFQGGALTINANLTSVPNYVFSNCGFTGSLNIPSTVTSLGESAFSGTHFSGSLSIPEAVTSIGSYTFYDCTGFTGSLTINENIASIGENAFSGCTGFTSLNYNAINCSLPTSYWDNWLSGCSALTTLNIGDNVQVISAYAFRGCSNLTGNLVIPNSVTTIGERAFYQTGFNGSLTIGENVTNIGDYAFYNDAILFVSITSLSETPASLGDNVFFDSWYGSPNIPVYVPCGSEDDYSSIAWGGFSNFNGLCSGTVTVVASPAEGGTVTGGGSFEGGQSCTVTATANSGYVFVNWTANGMLVSTLAEYTFPVAGDMALVAHFVPEGNIVFADANVKAICVEHWDTNGDGEMSYVEAASVTNLGTYFQENSDITSFNELQYFIGLTTIGTGSYDTAPFMDCTGLVSVTFPEGLTRISGRSFSGCTSLTQLVFPELLTFLSGFDECTGLTSITIPENVEGIGYSAFQECSNLIEINYNATHCLTVNGSGNWLDGCESLTTLNIGDNVQFIPDYAFMNHSGLTGDLVIPNSVTTIGERAFYQTGFNGSLTIGENVTNIGDYAFYNDAILFVSITSLSETPASLGDNVFFDSWYGSPNIPVYVPCGSEDDYSSIAWGGFSNFNGLCSGTVTVVASPAEGGTVTGGGSFEGGQSCTVTATANSGYVFVNWTANGMLVSTLAEYAFLVAGDMALVAHFVPEGNIVFADANVKAICVEHWDTNGDGELSYAEAASVTELSNYFQNNTSITSFDELQYFIGLSSIGEYAFYYCTGLTSITLPNSLTAIGNYAFYNCHELTGDLVIPNSVTTIGERAFYYCTGLTSITLPNSLTAIGNYAFYNCHELTGDLVIPNSVTTIGERAFYECTGFNGSITIGENVTNIGHYAFASCSNITTLYYNAINSNASNAYMDYGWLEYCQNLHTLNIGENVQMIPDNAFYGGWSDLSFTGDLVIPNSVTTIGENAFRGNGFTSITIGGNVESLGNQAFYDCSSISLLYCLVETLPALGENAFQYVNQTIPVYVPCNAVETYQNASWGGFSNYNGICGGVIVVEINPAAGGTTTGAGTYEAGQYCTVTATANAGYAFANWTKNGAIVSTNAEYTFLVLEDATLEAHFAQDGNIVFADANVKSICIANWDTNSDGELSYAEAASVTELSNYFQNNTSITTFDELQFFIGLSSIGEYAFYYCTGLTSITLPNSLTAIGNFAFSNCNELTSITLPNSLTAIGNYAFSNCHELTGDLVIPNSVTTIGEGAFLECTGFNGSLTIGENVTNIGHSAFNYCTGLTSITLPNSLTVIGDYAFYYCSNIQSITSLAIVPPTIMGNYAFNYCYSKPLFIPCGTLEAYQNADYWSYFTNIQIESNTYFVQDGLRYEIISSNPPQVMLTGFAEGFYSAENLVVPASIYSECSELNYAVTQIADSAFIENEYLVGTLTLPESLTRIGNSAFDACTGLNGTLVIPENVTWIGRWAFYSCNFNAIHYNATNCESIGYTEDNDLGTCFLWNNMLEEIVIGDNVTQIPAYAFAYTYATDCQLTLGNSVQTIGEEAFCNVNYTDTGLSGDLVIPASVLTIGHNAFAYNYKLTGDIVIPENMNVIGANAFMYCGFTSIHYNATNCESIGKNDSGSWNFAFWNNTSMEEIFIGDNVTQIPIYAFANIGTQYLVDLGNGLTTINSWAFNYTNASTNSGVKGSLVIPASVTNIYQGAFYGCYGLTEIWSKNISAPWMQNSNAFYGADNSIPVHVPCGSLSNYQNASYWSSFTNYSENPYVLVVRSNDEYLGSATVTQYGSCSDNGSIVHAKANLGGAFVNWTTLDGSFVSNNADYTFALTNDITLVANFVQLEGHHNFVGSGDWNDVDNWSPKELPTETSTVGIFGYAHLFDNATVASATVYNDYFISIHSDAALSVTETLTTSDDSRIYIQEDGQLYHANDGVNVELVRTITPYTTGEADGWHLIASPLEEEVEVYEVENLTANEYDLYYYDEPTHYWMNQEDAGNEFNTLENAKGYLYGNNGIASCSNVSQIGDISSTAQSYSIPMETYYKYSISEELFLASELVGVGTNALNSISWYCNSTSNNQQNVTIWMANVNITTLTNTSHNTSEMTLVYTGSFIPVIGWNEIVFNENSFSWDGISNVIVCVQNNTPTNSSSDTYWKTYSAGFSAFNYKGNNASAYDMVNHTYSMSTNTNRPITMFKTKENTNFPFEAQVGEGENTKTFLPMHALRKYSISEQLFKADELSEAGVGRIINSLSWFATAVGQVPKQNGISIWMANVSDTYLTTTSHNTSNMTLVYYGSFTPQVGWNEFAFNRNDFVWDGTSNVLVCVQRNNGDWKSGLNWQTHTTNFNASGYKGSDNNAYYMSSNTYTINVTTERANTLFKCVARNTTIAFKGEVKNGAASVNVPLSYTGTAGNLKGFNLVGNPYAHNVTSYGSVNVANGCYIMNDAKNDLIVSEITEENPLNPLEGFFVKATSADASITFNPQRGASTAKSNSIRVEVSKDNKLVDRLIVKDSESQSLEKLNLNEKRTQVFAIQGQKEVAIVPCEGNEQPFSFKASKNGNYTINVDADDMEFTYLHLIDNLTGNDVNLLIEPSYTFEAKTTDYASRFKLVFATGSSVDSETDSFAFINSSGNLTIFGIDGEATLQVIDVLGHVLSTEQFSGSYEKKISAAPGVYMVRLIQGNDVKVQKVVVR